MEAEVQKARDFARVQDWRRSRQHALTLSLTAVALLLTLEYRSVARESERARLVVAGAAGVGAGTAPGAGTGIGAATGWHPVARPRNDAAADAAAMLQLWQSFSRSGGALFSPSGYARSGTTHHWQWIENGIHNDANAFAYPKLSRPPPAAAVPQPPQCQSLGSSGVAAAAGSGGAWACCGGWS